MDPVQPGHSALETLRTVEFRFGLKGYNVDDVDEYLEKVAVEADTLKEHLRQAGERLRQAGERISQLEGVVAQGGPVAAKAPVPVQESFGHESQSSESLQRTLLLAQKFVDQAKKESEAQATTLVAEAQERARSLMADAQEKAQKLSTEADQRLRGDVERLEAMRNQLASDVENMARHLESERNRLRSSLGELVRWVDEHIQPANSVMAMRNRPQGRQPNRPQPQAQAPIPAPPPTGVQQPPPPPPPPPPAAPQAGPGQGGQVLDLRGVGVAQHGGGPERSA